MRCKVTNYSRFFATHSALQPVIYGYLAIILQYSMIFILDAKGAFASISPAPQSSVEEFPSASE